MTAVDVVRGLAMLTRMRVVEVPGATGWYDTWIMRPSGTPHSPASMMAFDLFVVHVEATDEAGHAGDATEKVRALEHWDSRILADLVAGLDERGPWRLLLLPDHPTPLHRKTHTADPVPYLMVDSDVDGPGGIYTEGGVASVDVVSGHSFAEANARSVVRPLESVGVRNPSAHDDRNLLARLGDQTIRSWLELTRSRWRSSR